MKQQHSQDGAALIGKPCHDSAFCKDGGIGDLDETIYHENLHQQGGSKVRIRNTVQV